MSNVGKRRYSGFKNNYVIYFKERLGIRKLATAIIVEKILAALKVGRKRMATDVLPLSQPLLRKALARPTSHFVLDE